MKHILRVPTKEQFAFIEAEFEGSSEDAVLAYNELTRAVTDGVGLPQNEWNEWLDGYLNGKTGELEKWEQMNSVQKWAVNEIKKSKKRKNGVQSN